MTKVFKLVQDFNGWIEVATGLSIPSDPSNTDCQRVLAWIEAGNTPDPADPLPDPELTQAEQLDALAAQSRAALANVSTLPEIKALVGGLIDGMQAIYGTQS